MILKYKKLGTNVQKYRKIVGLTQEKLTEIVDCSNSHIGQIENGRGLPSLEIIMKIANALGVSVDQLIIADSKYHELIYLREIS